MIVLDFSELGLLQRCTIACFGPGDVDEDGFDYPYEDDDYDDDDYYPEDDYEGEDPYAGQ